MKCRRFLAASAIVTAAVGIPLLGALPASADTMNAHHHHVVHPMWTRCGYEHERARSERDRDRYCDRDRDGDRDSGSYRGYGRDVYRVQ